jgi:hypothetical protein
MSILINRHKHVCEKSAKSEYSKPSQLAVKSSMSLKSSVEEREEGRESQAGAYLSTSANTVNNALSPACIEPKVQDYLWTHVTKTEWVRN